MGVSRFTVADVEKGKPGTSVAAYLGARWALGLLEQLTPMPDPDHDSWAIQCSLGDTILKLF